MAAVAKLDAEVAKSFIVIELTNAVMNHAAQLARQHLLRAADAIQLACALAAQSTFPDDELVLIASDQLNEAAHASALRFIDPTEE